MKIFNIKTANLLTLSTLFGITVFLWLVNVSYFVFKNHLTLSVELMVILGESAFIIVLTYAFLLSLLSTIKIKQKIIEAQELRLKILAQLVKKQEDDIESKQKNIEILREYIESKKI